MAQGLDAALGFIFDNIFIIVVIGFLGYFIYNYLKIRRKSFNIIDRSEVERLKFIERMRPNKVDGKLFLYRGKVLLGRIINYKTFTTEEGNIEEWENRRKKKWKKKEDVSKDKEKKKEKKIPHIEMSQMIVKPTILTILNPFAKSQCYQLNTKYLERFGSKIYLPDWMGIDKYFGIFYDIETLSTHHRVILKDNVTRTDINEMASVWFVKSQEQSTFDPVHAHSMAMKEKELEIELAKKKGMQETI